MVTKATSVRSRSARAMEAAHAELRTRCPKTEVARMDHSVDDED
jgi:hypothetical protein